MMRLKKLKNLAWLGLALTVVGRVIPAMHALVNTS